MRIPESLAQSWAHEPAWLASLAGLVDELAADWRLDLEDPIDTPFSLVVPAGDAVLKIIAPSDVEAASEGDALERWGGVGAVQLLARDEKRHALLIERCVPGTRLWDAGVDEVEVIADLLPRLQVELTEPHPFPRLTDQADRWAEDVPRWYAAAGGPFERELLDLAIDTFRTVDRRARQLVNQDLHGANVLAAQREPWLVIDPKPLAGERELEGSGLLRNASDPSVWLDALAELGLDRERARAWGVAHNLAWAWDEVRLEWLDNHVEETRRILSAR